MLFTLYHLYKKGVAGFCRVLFTLHHLYIFCRVSFTLHHLYKKGVAGFAGCYLPYIIYIKRVWLAFTECYLPYSYHLYKNGVAGFYIVLFTLSFMQKGVAGFCRVLFTLHHLCKRVWLAPVGCYLYITICVWDITYSDVMHGACL